MDWVLLGAAGVARGIYGELVYCSADGFDQAWLRPLPTKKDLSLDEK